jgi:hypothetical protein
LGIHYQDLYNLYSLTKFGGLYISVKLRLAGYVDHNEEIRNTRTYKIVVGKYRRKVPLWRITIHKAAVSGASAIVSILCTTLSK